MWLTACRSGLILVLAVLACERQAPAARTNDTAIPSPPPPETTAVAPSPGLPAWDSAAGPVFLVMGATAQQATVIVPDIDTTASLDTVRFNVDAYRALPFDLFTGSRRIGSAVVEGALNVELPDDCSAWPLVKLRGASDSTTGDWAVAFRRDQFIALGVDSMPSLSRPDSLRLVTEIARVASAAPGDTVESLRGIPFVVRRAYRATLPGGTEVVIAEVERALNQEANPVQEHLLVVAERDSGATRGYRPAYVERTAGGEENLASSELLVLGIPRGREHPVLLLARYLGDGVIYALLERRADGTWRLRWSSPYAGC